MRRPAEGWWASLAHGGLLITPAALTRYFAESAPDLPQYLAERLRRDIVRAADGITPLLDTVLERVLGLDTSANGRWLAGAALGKEWSQISLTRQSVRPRRAWVDGDIAFPIFVPTDLAPRLGVGRGRRAVAQVVEWLRSAGRPIALVTNGRQWRLIWAGPEADAWAEWDTSLWFQEGRPGDQVTALRTLLGATALTAADGGTPPLLAAITASRRGQAELSAALGEQVREAVEALIRACGPTIDRLDDAVTPRDVYIAGTRVAMRLVVVLFAEARGLLPRELPIYQSSYSLAGLRDDLERVGGGDLTRLRDRRGAWGRILGLFRLIHAGSAHQALPMQRYGGELFAPGSPSDADPVRRATCAFESLADPPSDAVVARILRLLTRSTVTVRQGRGARRVDVPVDFSDLSTEYLGILYEGLLDYELRVAPAGDPVVFLALGDQPALPLSRLEALDDTALTSLVSASRRVAADETEPDDAHASSADDELADVDAAESERDGVDEQPPDDDVEALDTSTVDKSDDRAEGDLGDERQQANDRAATWARRAAVAARLVPRGTATTAAARARRDADVARAATSLIARVVLPGERYLVRWGGTRKGAGTFYTPPALAVPTVERTLRPLAYHADDTTQPDADGWRPREPESILALRICDPAMGSASFLVAAVRFLSDALFSSLHAHNRIAAHAAGTQITLAEGKAADGMLSRDLLPVPPDAEDFEVRLRGRLKRYIVENCIYGVDIDPLAVELARLALWIETMDEQLPFEFLDHRLRTGNSLIGAWLDRVAEYPALAWDRKAGDEDQNTLAHHHKGDWGRALTAARDDARGQLAAAVTGQLEVFREKQAATARQAHDHAASVVARMAAVPVHNTDERASLWQRGVRDNAEQVRARETFDAWCAMWFWPAADIDHVPEPGTFPMLDAAQQTAVASLRDTMRFFHWELEFPDVFSSSRAGFDAVVGNPPWDTAKPNSKEFFSNIDPLYRAYGKQEALRRQREIFARAPDLEVGWLDYLARFKAQSNWVKHVARPFGDGAGGGGRFALGRGRESDALHGLWESKRTGLGYADPAHPFRHQGSADLNSFKLFLELSHSLLRPGGRLGLVVPSGIYSDRGTSDLRELFLHRCRWEWLFAFENRDRIFDIHRSFKFCAVIVEKGATTLSVRTAFMRRNPNDWANAGAFITPYAASQVARFSPTIFGFVEIGDPRDLRVLDLCYDDTEPFIGGESWQLVHSREMHMTDDSSLFRGVAELEAAGYSADGLDCWVAASGRIALPLYQGVMVGILQPCRARWAFEEDGRARWHSMDPTRATRYEPRYLVALEDVKAKVPRALAVRCLRRNIAPATNERTFVVATCAGFPSGHSLSAIHVGDDEGNDSFALATILGSFVFDWMVRGRVVGSNVSLAFIDSLPLPRKTASGVIAPIGLALSGAGRQYATHWMAAASIDPARFSLPWRAQWAVTRAERVRLRAIADAIVAALYNLDRPALRWILRDCDHAVAALADPGWSRGLDSKGFWRVDAALDPELRHPILTLVAFEDLLAHIERAQGDVALGVRSFRNQNGGDGWMLPEALSLREYGLGHDERAMKPQPVASALGQRHLPWQMEGTAEDQWAQCAQDAQRVRRLTATGGGPGSPLVRAAEYPTEGRRHAGEEASLFPVPNQGKLFP